MGAKELADREEGEGDEIEWDPAWDEEDEELDTAAAQFAEDEVILASISGWGYSGVISFRFARVIAISSTIYELRSTYRT
jgi:hypothetical protein